MSRPEHAPVAVLPDPTGGAQERAQAPIRPVLAAGGARESGPREVRRLGAVTAAPGTYSAGVHDPAVTVPVELPALTDAQELIIRRMRNANPREGTMERDDTLVDSPTATERARVLTGMRRAGLVQSRRHAGRLYWAPTALGLRAMLARYPACPNCGGRQSRARALEAFVLNWGVCGVCDGQGALVPAPERTRNPRAAKPVRQPRRRAPSAAELLDELLSALDAVEARERGSARRLARARAAARDTRR